MQLAVLVPLYWDGRVLSILGEPSGFLHPSLIRVKDVAPNFVGVGSAFEVVVAEEAKPLEHQEACTSVKHEPAFIDFHLTRFVCDCY